jgi:hypothetical protein
MPSFQYAYSVIKSFMSVLLIRFYGPVTLHAMYVKYIELGTCRIWKRH